MNSSKFELATSTASVRGCSLSWIFIWCGMCGWLLLAGCTSSQHASDTGSSHFASLGTNKIHYVVEGKGRHAIVFIHGWACNQGFWREQIPALAEHARLLLIDLPGHGQSDKPHVDYTMDYFAEAVLAVMRDA